MAQRKSSGWLGNAAVCRVGGRALWPGLREVGRAGRIPGAALALLLAGCGGVPAAAPAYTGSPSVAYTGAAVTAIAAGVLWAVGGGCKLQGCPYGSYCNQKTGFCDVRKCSEGCPAFTVCNEGLGRCQAPPPANPPTDFLPEDNLLQRPMK